MKVPIASTAGYTTTDPCLGIDKTTGDTLAVFCFPDEKTAWAADIWATIVEGKNTPFNLAEINTPGDEATHVHNPEMTPLFQFECLKQGFRRI
ncbi:MAG: hypothetical protein R2825_06950 [Saprospiraceae bacterium]